MNNKVILVEKSILFLLQGMVCLLVCMPIEAKKHRIKKIEVPMPEPDAWVEQTPLHKGLPEQKEAVCNSFGEFETLEGIDVSHYQGEVDWKAVVADGKCYAYIKATEGEGLTDEFYDYNIREARKAGLLVGSYHFFRAQLSVESQIANMTNSIKPELQDLIPIVDIESANRQSASTVVSRLRDFLDKVEVYYGQKPMLYTYVNFYNKYLAGEGFDEYPLMIAFYRDDQPELYDGKKYAVWQYTSHGTVSGVNSDVDCSKLMNGYTLSHLRYKYNPRLFNK